MFLTPHMPHTAGGFLIHKNNFYLSHKLLLFCVIGVDFKVKTIVLDNKRVKLSIWVSVTIDISFNEWV